MPIGVGPNGQQIFYELSLEPQMVKKWILPYLAALTVAVGIVACGGGSSNSSSATDPAFSLDGVAAIGAPLVSATVTLTDSQGKSFATTADANGRYSFGVAVMKQVTPPFLITATANLGDSQISHYSLGTVVAVGAWANITPLTSAVTALASPTTLPSQMSTSQLAALKATDVSGAKAKVQTVIAPLSTALGISSSTDLMSDNSFTANRKGVDLLLDHIGVAIRSTGVNISNKMAVVNDNSDSTAAASVSISKTAAPTGALPKDSTDTSGLDALAAKFEKCFKVAETERLTNKTVASATLHADCLGIAASDYLHNGTPFINRWASALNSSSMTGAKFSAPVVRLRLQAPGTGSKERISVNFNFKDGSGIGYTRPEVAEKQTDCSWLLVGNKRPLNIHSESALTYFDDVSTLAYNNTNFSRVDAGFRIYADPRAAFSSTGSITYAALDMTSPSGTKDTVDNGGAFIDLAKNLGSAKAIGCVVVTGPGIKVGAKWQGFHPNGILLKRADSSSVQDYMAIDSVVTDNARTAIKAATTAANGNFGAGQTVSFVNSGTTVTNLCTYNFGNGAGTSTNLTGTATTVWETNQSSSTYVVEMAALGARKNVLTGTENDPKIAGRNVDWNTGPRYARQAPSADLALTFDNNPNITFEVFDTDGKLRAVLVTRYLGDLPPAQMAQVYFDANRVSKFDLPTLQRYLSFSDNTDTVKATQNTVTANWTTAADAWGADRIMVYSEVQRGEPGKGIANVTGSKVSGLWASDPDLAASLNSIDGDNFYWWNGGYAKSTGTTSCSGSNLISSTGVSVSRATKAVSGAAGAFDGNYYGTDQLSSACIAATGSTSTKAYVYRELGTRTYTDTNTRLFAYTANKSLR